MSVSSTVSPQRLRERLIQVLALDASDSFNEDTARAAITGAGIQGAMCARESVGGKALNFQRYFEAVYGVGLDGKAVKHGKQVKRA